MAINEPDVVTLFGRLSFPTLTVAQAQALNKKSTFPKDDDKVKTNFTLILDTAQAEKLSNKLIDDFLPYAAEQNKKNEKRNSLEPNEIKLIKNKILDSDQWSMTKVAPFIPLKALTARDLESFPDGVAKTTVDGPGPLQDIVGKARVNDETELLVPDPNALTFPRLVDIQQSVFELYPGANVAATVRLYGYNTGALGISLSTSSLVFISDNDRIGTTMVLDEDEMFMDA